MSSLPVKPQGQLRTGYTTGVCAAACTKAALQCWFSGRTGSAVSLKLPDGEPIVLRLASCELLADGARCSVIKDAGDDPDVTHGAEIGCRISFSPTPGVRFHRGEGVGLVTLPGLPVPVGEAAINPTPRRMMTELALEQLAQHAMSGGVEIEVFVRGGEELAQRTLNPRLGVVGGVSIIGSTGRVRAFSSEAYVASILSAVRVAEACGCPRLVLNSGGRSESMLRNAFPELPEQAFVQYGNWIGEALKAVASTALRDLCLGLMLGKAVKLAEGRLDTHSRVGTWNRTFIAELARDCGYPSSLCDKIETLPLARQLAELVPFENGEALYRAIAARCHAVCLARLPEAKIEIRIHNEGAGWILHPAFAAA